MITYVPDGYASIQWAVDNATVGGMIIVRDGTYTENVNVNKRLTIRSENGAASTTVIAASSSDHVFEVTVDHVTISGFSIRGATDNLKGGIYLSSSTDHCTIENNRCGWDDNHYNNFGIYLNSSNDNTISGNTCKENNMYGVILSYSRDNKLTNNIASSNNDAGICLGGSDDNTVSDNWNGISLGDSSNNAISNNNANFNNGSGISLEREQQYRYLLGIFKQ